MKGLITLNTHVQYESPITSGLKVTAKVKVSVHALHADARCRDITLAPRKYLSRLAKKLAQIKVSYNENAAYFTHMNMVPVSPIIFPLPVPITILPPPPFLCRKFVCHPRLLEVPGYRPSVGDLLDGNSGLHLLFLEE